MEKKTKICVKAIIMAALAGLALLVSFVTYCAYTDTQKVVAKEETVAEATGQKLKDETINTLKKRGIKWKQARQAKHPVKHPVKHPIAHPKK